MHYVQTLNIKKNPWMGVLRLGWNAETVFYSSRIVHKTQVGLIYGVESPLVKNIGFYEFHQFDFHFVLYERHEFVRTNMLRDLFPYFHITQNYIPKVSHIHLADPKYHTKIIPILREPIAWLVPWNPLDFTNSFTEAIHSRLSRQ